MNICECQQTYGVSLGMPVSRHMPTVYNGANELRIKDQSGLYRVFYYLNNRDSVLVFYFHKKKTCVISWDFLKLK
ncbi:MAG: type II toxin-antitoxin system RelE/ParE family toxin [Bacteriovorax sp.]|nr:type II toxin-antitoxin system RelE/ParE family toxin [Bacteriovorax sp.]